MAQTHFEFPGPKKSAYLRFLGTYEYGYNGAKVTVLGYNKSGRVINSIDILIPTAKFQNDFEGQIRGLVREGMRSMLEATPMQIDPNTYTATKVEQLKPKISLEDALKALDDL